MLRENILSANLIEKNSVSDMDRKNILKALENIISVEKNNFAKKKIRYDMK